MKQIITLVFILLTACKSESAIQLILDTDCGPDYDDVGAMAVMYALEAENKCEVLAVMSCNKSEFVVPTVDAVNNFFGRKEVPVGELKGEGVDIKGWHKESWAGFIINKYKPTLQSGSATPDAALLYRKLLAEADDNSIVICTIGFLTNISNLLNTQPDEISQLMGKELVAKKVKHIVAMAGGFPSGHEFNIKEDAGSAINVATACPVPIYFCGFEVGDKVITGKPTSQNGSENNPVADAYRVALAQDNPEGRNSWDQVTVLAAINGIEPYFNLTQGTILIDDEGKNEWKDDISGNHFYMTPKVSNKQLENEIEMLMQYEPSR